MTEAERSAAVDAARKIEATDDALAATNAEIRLMARAVPAENLIRAGLADAMG